MASSKAAASNEARRYGPHFVGPFALVIDLGERKSPSSTSNFRTTLVESLSDARTMLEDFFNILLEGKLTCLLHAVRPGVMVQGQTHTPWARSTGKG